MASTSTTAASPCAASSLLSKSWGVLSHTPNFRLCQVLDRTSAGHHLTCPTSLSRESTTHLWSPRRWFRIATVKSIDMCQTKAAPPRLVENSLALIA